MSIVINTNVNALMAQNYLTSNQAGLSRAMQRLSSGVRINDAADDPAGLAIAAGMAQNSAVLAQGASNASSAVSLLQTAQNAMMDIQNIVTTMTTLAAQASNAVNSSTQLANLNTEFTALLGEINRVANNTTFNGITLLNGSSSSLSIQVGTGNTSNDRITINLSDMTTGSSGLNIATLDISSQSDAQAALASLSTLTTVTTALASVGSGESNLGAAQKVDSALAVSLLSAQSLVQDTDYAAESSNLSKFQIMTQSNIAMLAQANSAPQMVLKLLQ